MNGVDLAYIAGIMDGEGHLGVKKTKRKDCVSPTYQERIGIRMVDEEAINFIAKTLGGNYYKEKRPSLPSRRPLYCYQATDRKAAEIISRLLPYLKIKRKQALVLLELRKSRGKPYSNRIPGEPQEIMTRWGKSAKSVRYVTNPSVLDYRESLKLRIQGLNKGVVT